MKIALAQITLSWEDPDRNLAKACALVKQAARKKCDLIVFPEMFSTGFSMKPELAGRDSQATTETLSQAAKAHRLNIIAGYALKEPGEGKPRNTAVVFDRTGSEIARYAKINPFTPAGEERVFRPGKSTVVFELDGIPASAFICYDLRFPEIFRAVAREVQAVFVIANWPSARKTHWTTLLRARAIENQCYMIGVNRTGRDGNRVAYPGLSSIIGPAGSTVCAAGSTEGLLIGSIDPAEVSTVRGSLPFLRDMKL